MNQAINKVDYNGLIGIWLKLALKYYWRTVKGRVPIVGILHNWWSASDPFIMNDDENEMGPATVAQIKSKLGGRHTSTNSNGQWQKESLASYQIDGTIYAQDGDLASVVNGSHKVILSGSYEWCSDGKGSVSTRNLNLNVAWHDQMDANSFVELFERGELPAGDNLEKWGANIIEGILDLINEKIIGSDFTFQINYSIKTEGCNTTTPPNTTPPRD